MRLNLMYLSIVNASLVLFLVDVSNVILYQVLQLWQLWQHQQHYQHQHWDALRLVGLVSATALYAPVTIKCPLDRVLYPCKCHHNERILCTESMTYSVGHIFKAISHSLTSSAHHLTPLGVGPLYKEFVLSNKFIIELDNNLFHTVRFEKITLVDMSSLDRIKSSAFNGTTEDVQTFSIKGENKLGTNYVNEFFDSLSSLVNVRDMSLELNNLKMIPSMAFRDPAMKNGKIRLERLRIISRSLTQVASYAFYELPSLRSIKLHSMAGLQRISAHAFDIAQSSSHPLIIDLRENQLTVGSFELDAFQLVRRPIHLRLSNNNLTTIPREVFERFLVTDQQNKMQLAENPLECDCSMHWLLRDRPIYINQVLSALCDDFAEMWRLDETAFRKCAHDMNYMPRLIFRNSAMQPLLKYLVLMPIVLQLIL